MCVWVDTRSAVSTYDPFDLDQLESDDDLRRVASQLESETEEADFVWLMSGPKGRRFVKRLLDRVGVFRTSYRPNTMAMTMAEGAKQPGYWILDQIMSLCPDDYNTMLQENKKCQSRC